MASAINWFEIPVNDLARAKKFYASIIGSEFHEMEMDSIKMAFFPVDQSDPTNIGGALVSGEGFSPSPNGTLVYLNGGDDLNGILSRVEPAGGAVVVPKTHISDDIGYFAIFSDSEGNRVALHSRG